MDWRCQSQEQWGIVAKVLRRYIHDSFLQLGALSQLHIELWIALQSNGVSSQQVGSQFGKGLLQRYDGPNIALGFLIDLLHEPLNIPFIARLGYVSGK
jgi:hypothetical protein